MQYLNDAVNVCTSLGKAVIPYVSYQKPLSVVEKPVLDASIIVRQFSSSPWIKVAALAGATAVILGAYGAHGLKLESDKKAIFETANRYHFYHSLALLAVPFVRRPRLVGSLLTGGMVLFCGTCYHFSMKGDTRVIKFTPVGGFMLIFAWLALLF